MGIGIWQVVIVVVIVVLLFGRGKISDLMGDVAKGITSFKKGLKEEGSSDKADGPVVEGEKADEKSDDKG